MFTHLNLIAMNNHASLIIAITGLMICSMNFTLLSQAPPSFKYQAVMRDKAGQVLPNQNITLLISILQSGVDGPEVYRELHSITTSELGLINIEVGRGKDPLGSLAAIDWSAGSHFLRIEMDPSGGMDFELIGVSQLLSVPYALYAEKSGSGIREADLDWEMIGNDVVTGHGGSYPTGNVGIGNNAPGTLLYVAKNMGEPTITIRNIGGGGGATYAMVDDLSGADWKFKATTYGGFKIRDHSNSLDVLTMEPNSSANTLYIKTGGNVGIGTSTPHSSARLDVCSTNKGFLPPRMTKIQRNAIISPAPGLLVFQTDAPSGYYYYTGSNWVALEGSDAGAISSSSCIDIDGNAYPTITIGTQVWMAENLRVTHYRNGNAIPNVTDNSAWAALTSGAYCWYNNKQGTNAKYGALYNWYAVNNSHGLCPAGWHVPSDAEWTIFTNYLGGLSVAGGKMKSVSALWSSPNTDATNNSGFSGLPGGDRSSETGGFYNLGGTGYFWSSSQYSTNGAWGRYLYYVSAYVGRSYYNKEDGLSVRCLKDQP